VTPRQGHENCKLMAKNLSIQIGLRDPNCAKTHLRASVNSNIFRGYTPGTPWQKPIHSYNFSTHSQLFCPNGESNHFHNVLTSFFLFLFAIVCAIHTLPGMTSYYMLSAAPYSMAVERAVSHYIIFRNDKRLFMFLQSVNDRLLVA
jgi:hypothetical protein